MTSPLFFGLHWICQLWKARFWKVSGCLRDSLWDHPQQCGPSLNILVCQTLSTLSHLPVPRLGLQWCNCKDCTPVCNKVPINSSENTKIYQIHMNICIVLLSKLTVLILNLISPKYCVTAPCLNQMQTIFHAALYLYILRTFMFTMF